jgi:uncharacterized protein (TIGR03437 family)
MVAVTPTTVVAQMPIELAYELQPDTVPPNASSAVNVVDSIRFPRTASGVLRITAPDSSVQVSSAIDIPVIQFNPAIFFDKTQKPIPALPFHTSSYATATCSVDGSITAGDTATITIRDRAYNYVVQETDTVYSIRDAFVAMIHTFDPEVDAWASGVFSRIRLRARVPGPAGNGIPIAVSTLAAGYTAASATTYASPTLTMSAFNSALCCANFANAPITDDNPAIPGETIGVYATGLGPLDGENRYSMFDGQPYQGSPVNTVNSVGFVAALVGGSGASVLFSGLKPGWVGVYEVDLELNTALATDPQATLTISQLYQISNVVTIPIVNPHP